MKHLFQHCFGNGSFQSNFSMKHQKVLGIKILPTLNLTTLFIIFIATCINNKNLSLEKVWIVVIEIIVVVYVWYGLHWYFIIQNILILIKIIPSIIFNLNARPKIEWNATKVVDCPKTPCTCLTKICNFLYKWRNHFFQRT
jgi:hypothetical protein